MQGFDIFQQLKEATWEVHRQMEELLPIFDADFNLARYVGMIESFYGFWAPVETKLWHLDALKDPALDLRSRLKSHLLEEDLRLLGTDASTLPRCVHLPAVDTFSHGLGCLYVLEGSTLGARVISMRLETHLGVRDGAGASFFNAYGSETGRHWSEFKSFVTTRGETWESDEMVSAARQTFQCLYQWFTVLSPRSHESRNP